ncbi:unnamed protein product, partial [Polarella glacialis]
MGFGGDSLRVSYGLQGAPRGDNSGLIGNNMTSHSGFMDVLGHAALQGDADTFQSIDWATARSTESCVALAKLYARKGDVLAFEKLLAQMEKADDAESQMLIHNYYIHACSQAGDVAGAKNHIQRMEFLGLKPDLMTFNTLLNTYASAGDADGAERCIIDLARRGIAPNIVSFATLCKALARQGKVEQIEDVIHMIEAIGMETNEYFFASLVSACGVRSPPDLARAELILPELVLRGIRPGSIRKLLGKLVGEVRMAKLFHILSKVSDPFDAAGGCTVEALDARSMK